MIHTITTGYIALLSVYHLWSGAISYFAPEFALRFYRGMYGCDPVERRHLRLILRPWGALAIFAGCAGWTALVASQARPWLVGGLLLLLLLRIGYRACLREELKSLAGIASGRNALSIGMLVVGAILLLADLAWFYFSS